MQHEIGHRDQRGQEEPEELHLELKTSRFSLAGE